MTLNRKIIRRPWGGMPAAMFFGANLVFSTAFDMTARAEAADEKGGTHEPVASDEQQDNTWQPGQIMDFRVVNRETGEAIPEVKLELQNMGDGIDFQDVKVQTTDADGRSLVRLPDLPPTAVRVYPSKAGFVPLRVYWASEPSPAMPESITIPMDPGQAFGGILVDEESEPIPNVAVTVHYWGAGSGENPHIRANIDAETTSDEQGRWSVNVMPAEIVENKLRIFVNHPDYVSDHLTRAITPIPVTERPSLESLFDRTAVMTMKKGETIEGRVIDEQGKPVPDAKVYDRDYYWFDPGKATAVTDENGDFGISGVKPGPLKLTVQASGYAPELIDVRNSVLPLEIQLNRGHTVRGRVVDMDGNPVRGVSVYARNWREVSNRLHLECKTDADGTFRLVDAPKDEVEYDMGKEGYMSVDSYPMSPSHDEYTVTIKSPLRIVGSVVDAESGRRLNKFSLTVGTDYDDGRAPHWMKFSTKTITEGKYDTLITQEDFSWRLRVEADGYMPAVSRVFRPYAPDRGEVKYDFRLSKADALIGSVFGHDGEPLADADVYLATQRMNITDRKVNWSETPPVKTDPAGFFQFPAEVEPYCIVVVHPLGIAMLTEEDFASSTQIQIQPWTPENERLQIIRRPTEQQHVDFPK